MAFLQKVAGSKLFIGSRVPYKSSVVLADFAGQTWVEIDGWTETGDLGVEQEALTQNLINANVTLYSKGVISFPITEGMFVPDRIDPGQIALRNAQISCRPFAFKIEWSADCADVSAVTISVAAPGVVSWPAHGLAAGTPVILSTTGALPAGLIAGTTYFVSATPAPTAGTFSLSATPGGTAITTTGSQSGVHTATAQPVGDTDLFFGLAMRGVKSGGDASATRMISFPIQRIAEEISF